MDHRGWPPPASADQGQPQSGRSGYRAGTPHRSNQASPPSGPTSLPPPPGAPFSFHQPSHGLGGLQGLTQSSPRQPAQRLEGPHGQSHPPGYPLPGMSSGSGPPSLMERERERAREMEQVHIKEEEDRRHREQQERQRLDQAPPHHSQPGPPMLHQPVAVGPHTALGPNGVLGNPGIGGPPPSLALGGPGGPSNMFAGGPVQSGPPAQGPGGQPMQPGMLMPFAQHAQPPAAQQQAAQGQGQQPILNDALSYLDQVKVQFADHPDVYNRFLDIMKDFKSGAIDTPGVIGRVSTLFAGNPDLIQGFNTFLPPGYRIECGAGDDPNAIRVTTPMGTTVQSMPQPRPLSRQDGPDGARPSNGTYTPQPGAQSTPMGYSPSGRPVGPAMSGQQPPSFSLEAARQAEQQAMHVQEQRGVNSLQNAVSAAAGSTGLKPGASPRATPVPGQDANNSSADGSGGLEKRGPVEFNHAISYVNKIKNRFAQQPDIYKQFLEILQTYQRESKPIQDVYSQVTHLFKSAPDLLEDFKQFLPESAAHARAAERARREAEENAITSNVRAEPAPAGGYISPVVARDGHMGTPSHNRALPPVGNFAPTPISKDNKRKRERQGTAERAEPVAAPPAAKSALGGPAGKRAKQSHAAATKLVSEQPPTSPTLVPQLPTPLPPNVSAAATSDELAFFDRVKKAINNKNATSEFLKLCNLFAQDLIDRSTLYQRASAFIGHSPELMQWLKNFLNYDESDVIIENKVRIPTGRISLSNCRGLGPSYRLLPKRERQKPCSGRDELCNSVLNDEWASHPTWASEDSGFIAHRKNVYEEGLHRIEEERHDYDYNIEACSRTIQLLEPLAQQLRRMSDVEQRAWKLPPGLGGQSQTIYKRIIMKLYGREKGHDVITQLHAAPYQVIPVLLNRLKERLETWKIAQREWEKIWREQTQKMFWRSLDHQAVAAGRTDKRQFQAKMLQSEISVKHEEMKRLENSVRGTMNKPQLEVAIEDLSVAEDVMTLLLTHAYTGVATEQPQFIAWLNDFVNTFFGIDGSNRTRPNISPPGEVDDESGSNVDDADGPRARKGNGKNGNLLRTALDRSRGHKVGRKDREDSVGSTSRASTPGVASNADETEETVVQPSQRWFEHPDAGNDTTGKDVNPSEPQKRDLFHMWANQPIYCFVRMFTIIYERLYRLKQSEAFAAETIKTALRHRPADDLGVGDKKPTDFFSDVSPTANYYKQMLDKFQDVLVNDLDFVTDVEEPLRRYYLQSGYPLYTLEKMVVGTVRYATQIYAPDAKEKAYDIWSLYRKDRLRDTTTVLQQTEYRKAVEKMVKEGDLYKVDYDQSEQKVSFYLTKRDDPSYVAVGVSQLDQENRWRAYIASFQTVDDTDGVAREDLRLPFLYRNMRAIGADPKSTSYPPSPPPQDGDEAGTGGEGPTADRLAQRFLAAKNEENLVLRVAVNGYKAHFQPMTQEGWTQPMADREGGRELVEDAIDAANEREETMRDLLMNNPGMKDLSKEEVERKNEGFAKLCEQGREEVTTGAVGTDEAMDVD